MTDSRRPFREVAVRLRRAAAELERMEPQEGLLRSLERLERAVSEVRGALVMLMAAYQEMRSPTKAN